MILVVSGAPETGCRLSFIGYYRIHKSHKNQCIYLTGKAKQTGEIYIKETGIGTNDMGGMSLVVDGSLLFLALGQTSYKKGEPGFVCFDPILPQKESWLQLKRFALRALSEARAKNMDAKKDLLDTKFLLAHIFPAVLRRFAIGKKKVDIIEESFDRSANLLTSLEQRSRGPQR